MATSETKTYRIKTDGPNRSGEEFEIDVPASWKVTFGPLAPGEKSYQGGYAIRFYEAENKQRAVFRNVESFFDTSIPIRRKIKAVETEDETQDDGKGNVSRRSKKAVKENWESVK